MATWFGLISLWPLVLQAQDSALLSEEVRTQLEQVQQKLGLVREEVVENSISREKESFNSRRAQVKRTEYVQNTTTKNCEGDVQFSAMSRWWSRGHPAVHPLTAEIGLSETVGPVRGLLLLTLSLSSLFVLGGHFQTQEKD